MTVTVNTSKKHMKFIPKSVEGIEVSDGSHTFRDLYTHRYYLFCLAMTMYPEVSWRTLKHNSKDKDPMYEGYFLAGMDLPTGRVTYHVEIPFWNLLDNLGIQTLSEAPKHDGSSPEDCLERIFNFITEHKINNTH